MFIPHHIVFMCISVSMCRVDLRLCGGLDGVQAAAAQSRQPHRRRGVSPVTTSRCNGRGEGKTNLGGARVELFGAREQLEVFWAQLYIHYVKHDLIIIEETIGPIGMMIGTHRATVIEDKHLRLPIPQRVAAAL